MLQISDSELELMKIIWENRRSMMSELINNDGYSKFARDKNALTAIKNLIEQLNAEKKSKYAPMSISMPLVVSIEKVPLSELNQFIEKSYREEQISVYAEKALKDQKVSFYSVLY